MRCAEELLGIGQEEQVQRGGMSKDQWIVGGLFGIFCLDDAAQPSASGKLTRYLGPSRSAGPNHVLEDAVDGIFVENTDVSIGVDIHFECFELKALFIRFVVKSNRSKVREIGLGADRRIFRNDNRNFIALVLVWKGFNVWQRGRDPAACVPLVIAELGCGVSCLQFLLVLFSHTITPYRQSSYLFHPFQLTQLIELVVQCDPRTGHVRIDFAKPTFAHPAARTVAHKFGALGLKGAVWDRRALMHASDTLITLFFPWYQNSYRHRC